MGDNERMAKRIVVVGGGISGLTTAYRIGRLRPDVEVLVLEREPAVGGKVRTTVRDGYVLEWGPNGFLTGTTATLDLARELGLADELRTAAEAARTRYLLHDGGLRKLPASPPSFLASDLVSPLGKLRAAAEPAVAGRVEREESVTAFVVRHFGREVAERFAEALVLGVSAGDPETLSLDALFPRLRQLEASHRSLVVGMIARQRVGGGADRLTSFRRGTGQLVAALEQALHAQVRTNTSVAAVIPHRIGRFEVQLEGGDGVNADAVVLALPAYAAADLVRGWSPAASDALADIPFAPIRVVGLGYERLDVPRVLDGFGFLAPAGEGVRSLGVLWSSAAFPDHAPRGRVLLRVLSGGVRDPDIVDLDDTQALEAIREDLRRSMGITAEPEFVEQIAWPRGIPQYELGHGARVAAAERALGANLADEVLGDPPPLVLTGNSYRGIGLNDCVADATRAAEEAVRGLAHVKGA